MEHQNVTNCARTSECSSYEYYMQQGNIYNPEFHQTFVNHQLQNLLLNQGPLPEYQQYIYRFSQHQQTIPPATTPFHNVNNLRPIGSTVFQFPPRQPNYLLQNRQMLHAIQSASLEQFNTTFLQQQNVWPTMRQPCPVLRPMFATSQVQPTYQHQFQVDEAIHDVNEKDEESDDDDDSDENRQQEEENDGDSDGDDDENDAGGNEKDEEEQQNHRQIDFINPNNVFMDITNEQGADLDLA